MGEDESVNANPTVLVVQHDLDSPLAALEPPLAALGVRTSTWHAPSQPEPPAGEFDGLIVLGGIVNPDGTDGDAPLEREREVIADAHARGVPVLGICLGAQLIAQALDGSAERMPAGEIGWVPIEFDEAAESDALLAGAPRDARRARVAQLRLHAAGRRRAILARSPACVQAFRVGATTWGLQFHVEVTRPVLEEWARGRRGRARGARPAGRSVCSAPTSSAPSSCASRRASPIASRAPCSPPPSPPEAATCDHRAHGDRAARRARATATTPAACWSRSRTGASSTCAAIPIITSRAASSAASARSATTARSSIPSCG